MTDRQVDRNARRFDPAALAGHLLRDVFGYQPGAAFVLRALKTSRGEVGLGLSLGDRVCYFGVVNIGDADGLKKALEPHGLEVETDAFTPSLFADLERRESTVNLLIGSLEGSPRLVSEIGTRADLLRLESIAVTLLQRLLRSAWRRQQARWIRYRIAPLPPPSDLLPKEIQVRTIT